MELAIPIAALGSLYYISDKCKQVFASKDGFRNNGGAGGGPGTDDLEAPDEITKNYPVSTDEELRNTSVNAYRNPNQRTDKYFSKGVAHDSSINDKKTSTPINSLTGNRVDTTEFKHNNMVPFFGAKVRGRTAESQTSEQILDNMVGGGSQTIEKTETAPMFKPEDNMQYSNGAPNMNNFYQSRVNSSNRMANVKPWEEVQVGPGLGGDGFSAAGSGGFNSGVASRDAYKPKTVDEMRVKTNPKTTFELSSHEGPASYYNKSSATTKSIGKVEKYLPDTYFESGPERYFTTTGAEKKPTARGLTANKRLETQDSVGFYSGTHQTSGPSREPAAQNYKPSDKCDEEKQGYMIKQRNFTGAPREGDYGLKSINLGKTNRDCNPQYTVFNGIKRTVGVLFAPITDVMRPSKKEDIVQNYREYGNPISAHNSGFVEGTQQSPDVTNRDMNVDKEEYFGNIQKQNVASVNNAKYQLANQQRETTNTSYSGVAGSAESSAHTSSYANYNQTNNDTKEDLLYARTNVGGAAQFNNSINLSISKQDQDRESGRGFVPTSVPQMLPPSANHIGTTSISNSDDSNINMDRMQPDILDAFKKNPYTHSVNSVF